MPNATPPENTLMTHGNELSYSINACRGVGLCPFGLVEVSPIKKFIETALSDAGWVMHLKRLHPTGVRSHHRLRIAVAACPNGCSQPQIHDIGLIAPFRYMALFWAILLGYAVFGALLDRWTLTGAAIVVATGIFTLGRERRLRLARA